MPRIIGHVRSRKEDEERKLTKGELSQYIVNGRQQKLAYVVECS